MEGPRTVPSSSWSPTSWQGKPVAQHISYEDQEHLSAVISRLAGLPDLVPAHEIDQLSELMTHAARGEVFVIQGGDCAEAFRPSSKPVGRDGCTSRGYWTHCRAIFQASIKLF